jgi:YD repeat-containing protein
MNRAISTVDASGKETRYAYDIFGNLTRVIDVRVSEGSSPVTTEAVKEFWYDLDGRVVLEVRPAFETWSLPLTYIYSPDALEKGLVFKTYDAVGNLIRITDERGFVTRNWYDLLGRKVAERNGDGALRTFIYNVFGDVTSTTLDRTARSTLDVSDAAPLPVVAAADAITMRYEYDAKGRLTTTTWPQVTVTTLTDTDTATAVGAPTVSQSSSKLSTRTTYDAWGNVVSVRDANGATTTATTTSTGAWWRRWTPPVT